jgi:hypothetical protein
MTILVRQLLSSSNSGPRNQKRRTVAARVALLAVVTAVFWWIVRRLIALVSQTSLAGAIRRQLGDMYKLAFSHSFGRFL